MATHKPQKHMSNYFCEACNFISTNKFDYSRHIKTQKHLRNISPHFYAKHTIPEFICDICCREFKSRAGLWRHSKNCAEFREESSDRTTDKSTDKELMMLLLKDNADFRNTILRVLENGTTNINCNNVTHNKTFNLNVYLNETCKDAMNINDFVNSIHLSLEDLENTGRKGYIEGISNIFLKNLDNVEHHMRPIHCSDQKREILYIKNNDRWEKECEERPILTSAIKNVANQNIKQIKHWTTKYPDCINSESRKNDLYLKIVSNSMNGLTEEESKKNISKIISNVAKRVVIEK
jgi:hypothetical protein